MEAGNPLFAKGPRTCPRTFRGLERGGRSRCGSGRGGAWRPRGSARDRARGAGMSKERGVAFAVPGSPGAGAAGTGSMLPPPTATTARSAHTAVTAESAGMLLSAPGTASTGLREMVQEAAAAANRPANQVQAAFGRTGSAASFGRTGSAASFGRTGSAASIGRTGSAAGAPPTSKRKAKRSDDATGQIHIVNVRNEEGRPTAPHYHEHTFSNGDTYAGHWYAGMLSGAGVYAKPKGPQDAQAERYEGAWSNDVLQGHGDHYEPGGRIYEGEFKDGWRHGRGRIHLISKEASKPTLAEKQDLVPRSRPATQSITGPVVGKGGNPAAGQGTLEGAGAGMQCEWRNGVMMGKVDKVWYRLFEREGVLDGEDAHSTAGYINTINQHTGRIVRLEAQRRYDVSAGGRRYEFPPNKGGFNPALHPPFRPHTPRTRAMLSKGHSVYKSSAMHGWGDFTEARGVDEEVYQGDTKLCLDGDVKRHGKGVARWGHMQKESYSGEWLYDERHGKGERKWKDGHVYNGIWSHDHMEGKGSYRWPDGSKYNGEFEQGKRHGHGVQMWPLPGRGGVMEYDGQWDMDKRSGFGKLSYPDGRVFEGEWAQGRVAGRGKLIYANSWTYEGEFHGDMKHGRGIKTEWYGPTHGTRFAVRYKYNVLEMKRRLGQAERKAGETPSAPQELMDKYVGRQIAPRKDAPGLPHPAASRRHIEPPKLDLETIKNGGMLPVSPPASPPFSPTDNNRESKGDDLLYPAGNWSFGLAAGLPDKDPVDW